LYFLWRWPSANQEWSPLTLAIGKIEMSSGPRSTQTITEMDSIHTGCWGKGMLTITTGITMETPEFRDGRWERKDEEQVWPRGIEN